jgi:hypothetical protein
MGAARQNRPGAIYTSAHVHYCSESDQISSPPSTIMHICCTLHVYFFLYMHAMYACTGEPLLSLSVSMHVRQCWWAIIRRKAIKLLQWCMECYDQQCTCSDSCKLRPQCMLAYYVLHIYNLHTPPSLILLHALLVMVHIFRAFLSCLVLSDELTSSSLMHY